MPFPYTFPFLFDQETVEYRNVSDSGTGTDVVPYIEIRVQDEGKVNA